MRVFGYAGQASVHWDMILPIATCSEAVSVRAGFPADALSYGGYGDGYAFGSGTGGGSGQGAPVYWDCIAENWCRRLCIPLGGGDYYGSRGPGCGSGGLSGCAFLFMPLEVRYI